jgi:hypothetical protein
MVNINNAGLTRDDPLQHKQDLQETDFSFTLSVRKGNVDSALLAAFKVIGDRLFHRAIFSIEKGDKEGHLHIQAAFTATVNRKRTNTNSFRSWFFKLLNINSKTTATKYTVSCKQFQTGQTFAQMIGYCAKDKLSKTNNYFRMSLSNITEEEVAEALEKRVREFGNYERGRRTTIKKSNMYQLAVNFMDNKLPALRQHKPRLVNVLRWMLQSGEYTIASSWAFSRGVGSNLMQIDVCIRQ